MANRYKAKAIVFRKPVQAEVHEGILLPEMDDSGVVINTRYSGLSRGTELNLYMGQMHGRPPHTQWYPLLPGYMPVGEVIEVGSQVQHLQVGDIALSFTLVSGFDERYCPAWAGHTEYVVVSEHSHPLGGRRAVKVPEGVDLKAASIAMLAAVAYKGISLKVQPQAGERVLVVGQGTLGNCAAQLCRHAGPRVIAADPCTYRLEQSRRAGIEETINAFQVDLWEAVAERCAEDEPQKTVEVTGDAHVLEQCLQHAPNYGLVHAMGFYLEPSHLNIAETLRQHNLTFTSTGANSPEITARVLEMMREGALKLEHFLGDQGLPRG